VHGRRQGLGEDDFNFNFSIGIDFNFSIGLKYNNRKNRIFIKIYN
jgi:hypothetical protein